MLGCVVWAFLFWAHRHPVNASPLQLQQGSFVPVTGEEKNLCLWSPLSCTCLCCAVNRDICMFLALERLVSSFSSKTEHRSRGDNREQKVQGPIAVVAPPFPPFPAICSQKRQAIKDRHLLPVSLSLQLPHTNTFLPWWDLSVTMLHECPLPKPVKVQQSWP